MSEGPLISCPWFHDAVFIVLKASPEGYLFQASGITKGRKISSWSMWRRGKSKYFKGPFIKMLRRKTPYGNIIYMLIQLKVTRTSFLADLFSRSIYMERVQLFNGRYTKGVHFVKNSIYKGKGLDLGAKPLRTKLYWVAQPPPPPPPPLLPRAFHKLLANFLATSSISNNFFRFKQLCA